MINNFFIADYVVDASLWLLTSFYPGHIFISLFVGLIATLTLELPFTKIQKLLLKKALGGR